MKSLDSPEFARNYGFWSEAEQQALLGARVAIAGVGGVGFQVGTKLARMGVASFSIADPEDFEPQNANRVPGATTATYGRSKRMSFASRCARSTRPRWCTSTATV
jgi:tRNA A37 threonylcarbamoyladenosine dehydratase